MTGNQVLAQAINLNQKTQEDALVTPSGTEIVDAINRSLRGIYQIAARVNPSYMGATGQLTESSGVWTRPSTVELLYLLREATSGAEVFLSDPIEPVPDSEELYLIKWGRTYTRPASATSPTGNLDYWASRRPTALTALTEQVDLEDFFISLLVYDLGVWLAEKDERNDEVANALRPHLTHFLQLFVASLEHEAANVVKNVGQTGSFDTTGLIALQALLLSGTR